LTQSPGSQGRQQAQTHQPYHQNIYGYWHPNLAGWLPSTFKRLKPIGAGLFHSGSDSHTADGSAGRTWPDVSVHFPWPVGCGAFQYEDCRDVPGTICDLGPTMELYYSPHHPYTQALLSAIPELGRQKAKHIKLKGEVHPAIVLIYRPCFSRSLPFYEQALHQRNSSIDPTGFGSKVDQSRRWRGKALDWGLTFEQEIVGAIEGLVDASGNGSFVSPYFFQLTARCVLSTGLILSVGGSLDKKYLRLAFRKNLDKK
jgi:oligopeptide/dipeptide ABC transporter ATP-binding protein